MKTSHIVYSAVNLGGIVLIASLMWGLEKTHRREDRVGNDYGDFLYFISPAALVAIVCLALVISLVVQASIDSFRDRDHRGFRTLGFIVAAWVAFFIVVRAIGQVS